MTEEDVVFLFNMPEGVATDYHGTLIVKQHSPYKDWRVCLHCIFLTGCVDTTIEEEGRVSPCSLRGPDYTPDPYYFKQVDELIGGN